MLYLKEMTDSKNKSLSCHGNTISGRSKGKTLSTHPLVGGEHPYFFFESSFLMASREDVRVRLYISTSTPLLH